LTAAEKEGGEHASRMTQRHHAKVSAEWALLVFDCSKQHGLFGPTFGNVAFLLADHGHGHHLLDFAGHLV